MKYDDAYWHYSGDFPDDLPKEAGATHIGMFLCWLIQNGLESDLLRKQCPESLELVRSRKMTGREFLLGECDGKFTDEDVSRSGREFTEAYFHDAEARAYGPYLDDYKSALSLNDETLYSASDDWATYDRLRPLIDSRFRDQREQFTSS